MTKRKVHRSPTRGTLSDRQVRAVMGAVHVAPEDGQWVVLRAGPRRVRRAFGSRVAAMRYAVTILEDRGDAAILHKAGGGVERATSTRLKSLVAEAG